MSDTLRVVHVPREGAPTITEIPNTYEAMRGLLDDGWLEHVPLWGGNSAYCDEEGRFRYPNAFEFILDFPHRPAPVGAVVTPLPDGGQFVALTSEQWQERLAKPPEKAQVGLLAPFFIVGPGDDEGGDTSLSADDAQVLLGQLIPQASVRDSR